MVEQSKTEGVGVRFSAYIGELREFFMSRGVPFGSPEDVVGFADRVGELGPFQEEMGSLVRSIFFQESEHLGRGELLELVAVAVGGPEVETAAQQMHTSVRQIVLFVNAALQQRQYMIFDELSEGGESSVTAGDILAASAVAREGAEERSVAGKVPGNGLYTGSELARNATPRQEAPSASSGMLFKAVSMSEAEQRRGQDEDDDMGSPGPRRPWLLPAGIGAVVVLIGGLFFSKVVTPHTAATSAPLGVAQSVSAPINASACVAGPSAGSSRANLQERSRWAHNLLDQKLYEAALPELRAVAQLDPGFPGINLDQSDALLQLKRPQDARDVVDTQIGISECLAKLPGPALDAYCRAEFSPSTVGGCRPQLAHIRQAAELQAALIHLELGHQAAPDANATEAAAPEMRTAPAERPVTETPTPSAAIATAAPVVHVRRPPPLPPATEGDTAQAPRAVESARSTSKPKPQQKPAGDDSLRRGEGTDSALGAYSRPQ